MVNNVVSQQEQVRHRFNVCAVLLCKIVSAQTLLIAGYIL